MKAFSIIFFLLVGLQLGLTQPKNSCKSLKDEVFSTFYSSHQRSQEENIAIFKNLLIQSTTLDSCSLMEATICRALANFYIDLSDYTTTDSLCTVALKIDSKINNKLGMAKTYNVKTGLEYLKGNPLKGIECSNKAFSLLDALVLEGTEVSEQLINEININRASCLIDTDRNYEAKQLYLQLSKDGSGVMLEAIQGLADIAFLQSNFDSAIVYYKQLYPAYEDDLYSLAHLEHSIGTAYMGLKDTLSAKKYFIESKNKANDASSKLIHFHSLLDLLNISMDFNDLDAANSYKEELFGLLETSEGNIGDKEDQIDIIIGLAADFIKENKHPEALHLLKDYTEDTRLPIFYKEVKEKVEQKQLFRLATYFIVALTGIILFLIYARKKDKEITEERFRKEKIKKEKEVTEIKLENELLAKEKEKQELSEKNALLELDHAEELLKTEYDLRRHHAFLAHDLKGDAMGIRHGLNTLVDFYEQQPINKDKLETLYQDSILLSEDIRSLSKGLEPNPMDWLIKLGKMLGRLEEDTRIKTTIKAPDIIDSSLTPFIGHRILTILRVLIDNVKEHARASKLDIITTYKSKNLLKVSIEDNGQGDFQFPKDAGVGLNSVIKRIEELNGELIVDTSNGTKITMEIPLKKLEVDEEN